MVHTTLCGLKDAGSSNVAAWKKTMSGKPEVALKSGLPQSRQKALLTVFPLSATSKWTLGSPVIETSALGKPNWAACPLPVIRWHCLCRVPATFGFA